MTNINEISNLRYKYKKKNILSWKICIDKPFLNTNKIYPIQQRKVRQLIDDISANNNINKIIIFGSSVNDRCHIGSDVDVYVETNSENIILNDTYDFAYDLFTNHSVDDKFKNEIINKGVVVYTNQK